MSAHESQRSPSSAGTTLFTCRAVDLFVPQIVAQALTAPRRNVLLLLQRFFYRTTPPRHFDLQSLEEAFVGPVRVTTAPVALLWPFPLGATPPLVVGAVALPA